MKENENEEGDGRDNCVPYESATTPSPTKHSILKLTTTQSIVVLLVFLSLLTGWAVSIFQNEMGKSEIPIIRWEQTSTGKEICKLDIWRVPEEYTEQTSFEQIVIDYLADHPNAQPAKTGLSCQEQVLP